MIVDLDSHLREGYFLDEVYRLDGPYARYTPVRLGEGRNHRTRFLHPLEPGDPRARACFKHPYMYDPAYDPELAERQVGGYDLERRLEDIRREGIDKQVIFPTGIGIPTRNVGGLGAALCRAYNTWVAKLVKGYEDVFLPVAMAPAGCPDAMADELRRCVTELGMRAGHLVAYCGPRNLDDPVFYPYYQAAEELGVPLFCHPNSDGDLTDRFDTFFKLHVLGRPMNCTAALVALVLGGVFEKFPKLRVVFFECSAEWILYWMHRMDDDYEWARRLPVLTGAAAITMPPSEYVRRNCYVTCEADEKHLPLAIEELGAERICLATDYPHFDSEFPHTVSGIRARTDISARDKELILGGNAARLLGL
ncbi:MAG TPA: amidohydrolase family protein [Thermodesulfobacteriota bacterium]|nr:amidohydrolase family protein [Thermodesulfobacteriota bacterium]